MDYIQHFGLMALYNRRMNAQLITASQDLGQQKLNHDCGLFFISILGTFNHLMVGDLLWLRRFQNLDARFKQLDNLAAFPQATYLKQELYSD